MSELALPYHRKYRPTTIKDYVGNDAIKTNVIDMLSGPTRPQLLLFSGAAGCGKTTMARLVAKEYLCTSRDKQEGSCGVCLSCLNMQDYIRTGSTDSLMAVKEVDIAESNKKHDLELVLEESTLPTYDGSWRIYIMDEFHMATVAAQNMLLKLAEEPPEKVLIILCTTDPEQILETIKSRVQYIFKVKKPSKNALQEMLRRVCGLENIKTTTRALSLLIARGSFVPRQVLILLEQVVKGLKGERLTVEKVSASLDLITDKYYFRFFELVEALPSNVTEYITFLGDIKSDIDLKQFVLGLCDFTLRGIYVNHGVIVDALDKEELSKYRKLFARFDVARLAILLDFLLNLRASKEIEARLMLLGYTGLGAVAVKAKDRGYFGVSEKSNICSASEEKKQGNARHIANITMSEREKAAKIEEHTKKISGADLATFLGGRKVIL